jgi:hypothetical protein
MRDVIVPLQIPEHAVTRLRGEASDPVASCREYDRALDRAGGYDLALLGLGPNGHVAFNEPPADPASDARAGRDRGERRERHPLLGLAGGGAPPREGDADPMTPASLLNRSADVTFLTDLPIR